MLKVFITVDVEIWCGGWNDLDRAFPDAFCRYVYGPTRHGQMGLPRTIEMLSSHGLKGVFFVEPLFATRFGLEPLREIVALVGDARQEVQLHLHTEWVDEALQPLLPRMTQKRQHLRHFSVDEQETLIAAGIDLLARAGVPRVDAFRAGSFAFNADTLPALARNGIRFDSSYNASQFGPDSGLRPGETLVQPTLQDEVYEYPMTVYDDGSGRLRHAQITACTYRELEGLLWSALESGHRTFVLLSHGFELLNRRKDRPDWVAMDRFDRLCRLLNRNRDCFEVVGFRGLRPETVGCQPPPLSSPRWKTAERMLQQLRRELYR